MIYIDTREHESVIEMADKVLTEYKREKLTVGDFIVGNIIIERKEINDLYSSVNDGTLFRQLRKIQDFFENNNGLGILLIEDERTNKHTNAQMQYLPLNDIKINAMAEFNVGIIVTKSLWQTIKFIKDLNNYKYGDKEVISNVRGYKPSKSLKDKQYYFLNGLPRIGKKRSEAIMKKYNNLMEYFEDVMKDKIPSSVYEVLSGEEL